MEERRANELDTFHAAATRLSIFLSGTSHDVFAADVFYHKNCYSSFTYSYTKPQEEKQRESWKTELLKVSIICSGEESLKTKNLI